MMRNMKPAVLVLSVLSLFTLTACSRDIGTNADRETNNMMETNTEVITTLETEPSVVTETADITSLTVGETYIGNGTELFTFKAAVSTHGTVQGGYFDGTTFYVAEVGRTNDNYETVRIHTMTKEGETIGVSEPLALDHANNITYHPTMDKLVVSHCQSPDGHYYRYSFVDPNTFEITKTGDKDFPFFSMAYSPERDMYASGEWAGEIIDICDGNMNLIKSEKVKTPKSLSQGVFCDENYIYFVRSSLNGVSSEIRIYDWDCSLVFTVPLTLEGGIEPENINIVDGVTYVIGNDWNRGCGVVYTVDFKLDDSSAETEQEPS